MKQKCVQCGIKLSLSNPGRQSPKTIECFNTEACKLRVLNKQLTNLLQEFISSEDYDDNGCPIPIDTSLYIKAHKLLLKLKLEQGK